MLAVETHNLSKLFGKLQAVAGIDLEIRKGEIYGLLGPNGSGKTTLIRLLTGILKPSGGTVALLGQKVPNSAVMSRVGYMTQAFALYDDLTVRENIAFFASMCGAKNQRRIDEVLELVDLSSRRKSIVRNLSGGMKRRTSLACALVHEPELLLLDEPTVGVDPTLRVAFWDYFQRAADSGCTLVISSHVMEEARRCSRLGFIRSGKLIAEGDHEELIQRAGAESLEDAFLHFASNGDSI